jgi:hypothetical protein
MPQDANTKRLAAPSVVRRFRIAINATTIAGAYSINVSPIVKTYDSMRRGNEIAKPTAIATVAMPRRCFTDR